MACDLHRQSDRSRTHSGNPLSASEAARGFGTRLSHLEPKSAYRKLKEFMTADLSEHSPVAPIMVINKDDHRIVAAREVLGGIERVKI